MLRRALPFVLVLGCSHPRPSAPPPPPPPPTTQLTLHLDPLRFKAGATLTIELVIDSGYSCRKEYPLPELPPTSPTAPPAPSPAPCPAMPPDVHEQHAAPVAGVVTIASAELTLGRDFTVIVTGPAAAGCDLVRGYARGAATGAAIDVPALELVVIPQPCPA